MSADEAAPFAEVMLRPSDGLFAPGSSIAAMSKMAADLGIAIVWGFVGKDPNTNKLYNAQAYVDPKGYLEFTRKINPWGNDYLWATPGRENPPVISCDVTGLRVGLLICRDIRDKKDDSWSNFYSKGDADVIAFSTAWGDGGFPATTWMDFVEEHNISLIVANRYGQEQNNNFGEGGSCILTAPSKVECRGLLWNQDCVILGEV